MSPREPSFDGLPGTIPVFPLPEVLLLPGGRLPLNIFEPRYLAMVEDALAEHRMIGMIQPCCRDRKDPSPALYRTGCAGRIARFEETGDGRYLIALNGVCRFDVAEELPLNRGYRRVRADWSRYEGDMACCDEVKLDRTRLLASLRRYFEAHGLSADWAAVGAAPDERLVTCLAMICPFDAPEKQALLEAPDLPARAEVLTTLVEMAALGGKPPCGGGPSCQ